MYSKELNLLALAISIILNIDTLTSAPLEETMNIQLFRQRLRICMIHKHATIRRTHGMCYKWNTKFFECIGLISSKC